MIFGTLGPSGSNHHWVADRYLAFQHLEETEVRLFADFDQAFTALLQGDIDFVIQVAVHPALTEMVARYRNRAHIVDTFISPSQPMAVLTRSDVDRPRSLGLQMATREYVDTSRWPTLIAEPSTVDVAAGLLQGKYDSGLTLTRILNEYPASFRLEEEIGTVVDPWIVFGREAVCGDGPLAWPDSPASRMYKDNLQGG
jgi:hypothetical protein